MVILFAIAVPWLGRWAGQGAGLIAAMGGAGGLGVSAARTRAPWRCWWRVAIAFPRRGAWCHGCWRAPRGRARARGVRVRCRGVALGSAWLTSWAGLSLALGAFIAGLILGRLGSRARASRPTCSPFRDALSGVFFISIGMLFDAAFRARAAAAGAREHRRAGRRSRRSRRLTALRLAGAPWRVCAGGAALSSAQVGRVLVRARRDRAAVRTDWARWASQAFYAGAVFSLMLTPLLVEWAPELALALERRFSRCAHAAGRAATRGRGRRAAAARRPRRDRRVRAQRPQRSAGAARGAHRRTGRGPGSRLARAGGRRTAEPTTVGRHRQPAHPAGKPDLAARPGAGAGTERSHRHAARGPARALGLAPPASIVRTRYV